MVPERICASQGPVISYNMKDGGQDQTQGTKSSLVCSFRQATIHHSSCCWLWEQNKSNTPCKLMGDQNGDNVSCKLKGRPKTGAMYSAGYGFCLQLRIGSWCPMLNSFKLRYLFVIEKKFLSVLCRLRFLFVVKPFVSVCLVLSPCKLNFYMLSSCFLDLM